MGIIYKLNFPNGRYYIGKTVSPKKRFGDYSKGRCETQPLLYNNIIKYGWDNVDIEILYENEDELILYEMEELYIKKFKSNFHKYRDGLGLNLCDGGAGVVGFKHTEEAKRRISEASKVSRKNSNPVIDLNSGIIYNSAMEYCKKFNIHHQKLSHMLKGNVHNPLNVWWVDEEGNPIINKCERKSLEKHRKELVDSAREANRRKSTSVTDKRTGIIYESLADAMRKLKVGTPFIKNSGYFILQKSRSKNELTDNLSTF